MEPKAAEGKQKQGVAPEWAAGEKAAGHGTERGSGGLRLMAGDLGEERGKAPKTSLNDRERLRGQLAPEPKRREEGWHREKRSAH